MKGLLEEKSIPCHFSVAGRIDRVSGLLNKAIHMVEYYDLVMSLTGYKSGEIAGDIRTWELRGHIKEFKRLLEAICDELCETGLDTAKGYPLDLEVDDLLRFAGVVNQIHRSMIVLSCIYRKCTGPHLSSKAQVWWNQLLI